MGWIGCVRCEKFRHEFMARTFALIAPVHPALHPVSCSYEMIPNAPNTLQCTKKWVYCPMGWIRCVCCEKLQREFVAQTFALIALVHPALHLVSCSYETIPNAPKPYATYQNIILWSNVMDQVCSLRKITKWLRGTNLCTNCTSSPHFASSFMQLRYDPRCTQILRNGLKH